jgi:hypothetical protein
MEPKRKYLGTISILSMVLFFGALVAVAAADQSGLRIPEQVTGDLAWEHAYYLSEEIGARIAGTSEESEAADYIIEQFDEMGYDVEVQEFTFFGGTIRSENIIATKPGKIDQTVIVGAHYDSVYVEPCDPVHTGAGDNASGVGVMLEVAEILANYKTHGIIKFVAFGAEEFGLQGSRYYASQMTEEDIDHAITMINLDSVGAGDHFNVYAGWEDNPGWARDLALKIGQRMGYDLRTSPGSDCWIYGTAGDWSDHAPFRLFGIPIAYFEWMNWEADPCWGLETEEFGWIMHTCRDNLDYTSHMKLEMTADVVAALVFELSKTKLPKAEKGRIAKGNKYIRIMKRTDLSN